MTQQPFDQFDRRLVYQPMPKIFGLGIDLNTIELPDDDLDTE